MANPLEAAQADLAKALESPVFGSVHPDFEFSDDDQDLLLASGTADLQAALNDLESDLPPGEVDSWLETLQASDKREE